MDYQSVALCAAHLLSWVAQLHEGAPKHILLHSYDLISQEQRKFFSNISDKRNQHYRYCFHLSITTALQHFFPAP